MSFSPIITTRSVDLSLLYGAVATQLLTNSTITGIVGTDPGARIYRDVDVIRATAYPLIALSVVSVVPDLTYSSTGLNALMDIQAVDRETAANADALVPAFITALVDSNWTVPGYTMNHIAWSALPNRTDVDKKSGVPFTYAGITLRVLFRK